MKTLWFGVAALVLAGLAVRGEAAAGSSRPNIVIIVSDDQGFADAGFQGSKEIRTPHLDALASAGVRCTRGYVTAPVCSPSRAGLLTGRYQQKFGHHNNIVAEAALPIAHLPAGETLLPEVLAEAGYETAMVGKWHLGLQDGFRPHERGFQNFFGVVIGGHDYFINRPNERPVDDSSYKARIERNGVGMPVPGYLTDAFGDEAARIIRQQRDKPLFLYLAFNAPHTPTQAPDALVEAQSPALKDPKRRILAAQIASMDANIGKVRAALKDAGMDQNTFIVFFSDNGGAKFPYYDNTPLRDHKGTLYEGGIRVPFLVVYPPRVPAGTVCHTPVTTLDVFATARGLAQVQRPSKQPLDSVDMLPVLAGETQTATHAELFWHFPGFGAAMSAGNLKLILRKNAPPELFDLGADVAESHNLAAARPGDLARLKARLEDWIAQNPAPLWGGGSPGQEAAGAKKAKAAAGAPPKSSAGRSGL